MDTIKIGKIVNTFGINGELKIVSDSEFIEDRFKVDNKLYLNNKEEVTVSSFRMHKNNVLIKVDNLNDINLVLKHVNKDVYFSKADIKPLENEFYLFQLEDLDVYSEKKKIGRVIEVLKPAQTVLRIQLEDREMMLPFVDAFIEDVDLDNKIIHVNLIEGM